jgi:3-hydroxymyristoyl/3-hydroxydecanoyl-(acyl carrier protein) dehydratase
MDETGGLHGEGRVVAQMDVDPGQWFFKAHFFTDPVQPGSLGLQLMLDALSLLDERHPGASVASGDSHVWKYRGQVRPWNREVTVDVHRHTTEDGLVRADGWLWVDGECIYRFEDFGL